jgi:hypothetical protein
MKGTAEYGLRILSFGGHHNLERVISGDINIAAHEIDKVSPLQKHLGQPGIVVVLIRNMTVAARFCFFGAHRMRYVCVERLTGEALGRGRLLL